MLRVGSPSDLYFLLNSAGTVTINFHSFTISQRLVVYPIVRFIFPSLLRSLFLFLLPIGRKFKYLHFFYTYRVVNFLNSHTLKLQRYESRR